MTIELGVQLHVGGKGLHPLEKIKNPISNHINCKANGGLFTSTFINERVGSDWVQWCLGNEYGLPKNNEWHGWLVYPKKNIKIYVVNTLEDMNYLYDNYGYKLHPSMRMEAIDFTKVYKDYDAFHITREGERICRHGFDFFNPSASGTSFDERMRNMYGYDCETSHFSHEGCIEKVEPIVLKDIDIEHNY